MTNGTKKTTVALSAAVMLASAGYALGSGAGGGAASAAGGSGSPAAAANVGDGGGGGPRERGGPGRDLSDLASRLGTTEAKLRAALEAVRDDAAPTGDRKAERVSALASALGKTTAEVEKAFEQVHEARETAFAAALADELGIEASKVEAALTTLRADKTDRRGRGGRREGFDALASELGVTAAQLRTALQAVRPERHDHDGDGADLAKALGVTEEQLEAAQEKAHEAHEAEHEQRAKAFAAALAKELGISAAKVEEELGDRPFFGGHGRGHHGPR